MDKTKTSLHYRMIIVYSTYISIQRYTTGMDLPPEVPNGYHDPAQ